MKKGKIVLTATLFQMLLFSVVLGGVMALRQDMAAGELVGVRVGDWVKYDVTRLGPDPTAWTPPPMGRAVWVKVEVQNVSGTVIKAHETIHLTDGSQRSYTRTWDLQDTTSAGYTYYILHADLNAGDKIGERIVFVATDNSNYEWVELTINATVSRSYGESTREVNMLNYSYIMPYFEYMNNYSIEYYWDRESGFMLERKWEVYYLEHGNATPMSTLQLKISDTNMWKMETGDESILSRLWPWAAVSFALAVVAGATILMRFPRNSRKRTKTHESD